MRDEIETTPWYKHPYLAPIREPLRIIGHASAAPIKSFVQGVAEGLSNERGGTQTLPARIYNAWARNDDKTALYSCTTGGMFGTFAGIIFAMGTLSFHLPLQIAVTAAAGVIGFAAAPVAIMGILAVVGAAVGIVYSPAGIIDGGVKALKHFREQKAATMPPVKPSQKMLKAISRLPLGEQEAIAKGLTEKLGPLFSTAANASSPAAIVAAPQDAAAAKPSSPCIWRGGKI